MIPHPFPWRLAGRLIAGPLQRLFSTMPHVGYGIGHPQLTRLACDHAPLHGHRAVQLSDLHLDRFTHRHDHVIRMVADLRPSWIFITGDLLNHRSGLPHLFRFLHWLRRTAPVFITLGNHDHYSGVSIDEFDALAARHDITLLVNRTVTIPVGADASALTIVGVDDPSLSRARVDCIPPRRDGGYTVLLAHAPNILEALHPRHEVDLILCGHSHGGQWRPPNIRPFWLPPGCHGRAEDFMNGAGIGSTSTADSAGPSCRFAGTARRKSC